MCIGSELGGIVDVADTPVEEDIESRVYDFYEYRGICTRYWRQKRSVRGNRAGCRNDIQRIDCHIATEERIALRPKKRYIRVGPDFIRASTIGLERPVWCGYSQIPIASPQPYL
jgi:hypothetical protein